MESLEPPELALVTGCYFESFNESFSSTYYIKYFVFVF